MLHIFLSSWASAAFFFFFYLFIFHFYSSYFSFNISGLCSFLLLVTLGHEKYGKLLLCFLRVSAVFSSFLSFPIYCITQSCISVFCFFFPQTKGKIIMYFFPSLVFAAFSIFSLFLVHCILFSCISAFFLSLIKKRKLSYIFLIFHEFLQHFLSFYRFFTV